jgi:Domain of unknown function (DUF4157)
MPRTTQKTATRALRSALPAGATAAAIQAPSRHRSADLTAMGAYRYTESVVQRRAAGPSAAVFPPAAANHGTGHAVDNRTGLPSVLKTGIESLSGFTLDNVRVHYDSPKPAQMAALAYTQGSHVYLGPRQERHLPHEAWHVVQQRQGRVKPTVRTKHAALNVDRSLESEADVMGARAFGGSASDSVPMQSPAAAGGERSEGAGVIQAKMGFEFQTVNPIRRPNGRAFDFKTVLYRGNGFKVEPDGLDMEVITDPFDYWQDMSRVLAGIYNFINELKRGARGDRYELNARRGWNVDGELTIDNRAFDAAIQATEGVPLEHIGPYLAEHLDANDEGKTINQRALGWAGIFGPQGRGLLKLIGVYLRRAHRYVPDPDEDTDGPKALFRVMARTDFHAMYESLPPDDKTAFQRLCYDLYHDAGGARNAISQLTGERWNDYVFPNRFYYDGYDRARPLEAGPSTVDWLCSIAWGGNPYGRASNKDLMSPPLATAPENLRGIDSYGMGREGIDRSDASAPLPLFEMRGLQSKFGLQPYWDWRPFAQDLFFNAIARNPTLQNQRPQPRYQARGGGRYGGFGNGSQSRGGRYSPYSRGRSRSPVRSPRPYSGRRRSRSRSRSRSPRW